MNRFEPSIPRVALGIAAVAMTAVTIGLAVVVPAKMEPSDQGPGALAASAAGSPASTAIVIDQVHINVVGVRARELVSAQARDVDPRCKQQEI
jgi:hypothetical protein